MSSKKQMPIKRRRYLIQGQVLYRRLFPLSWDYRSRPSAAWLNAGHRAALITPRGVTAIRRQRRTSLGATLRANHLYGTTYSDGAYGYGSVFKLTPASGQWTYTSLHDFCSDGWPCSDGGATFRRSNHGREWQLLRHREQRRVNQQEISKESTKRLGANPAIR